MGSLRGHIDLTFSLEKEESSERKTFKLIILFSRRPNDNKGVERDVTSNASQEKMRASPSQL